MYTVYYMNNPVARFADRESALALVNGKPDYEILDTSDDWN